MKGGGQVLSQGFYVKSRSKNEKDTRIKGM